MSFIQDINYNLLKIINWCIYPVEKLIINKTDIEPEYPPIFIIGPPRSGTTLAYQLVTSQFDVLYINNLLAKFFRFPNVAVRLLPNIMQNPEYKKLSSHRGKTEGIYGPHEFGEFWYRWFPKNVHYADEETLRLKEKEQLKNSIANLIQNYKRSIVFKNVIHSMRIKALNEIFPDALFIHCERDPLFTAQSIFIIRKELGIEREDWWSVKPKEYEEIKDHSLFEQVVLQVYLVNKQIQKDRNIIGKHRFYRLNYEDLCSSPKDVLMELKHFLEKYGIKGNINLELFKNIQNRNDLKISLKEFGNLQSVINEYYG